MGAASSVGANKAHDRRVADSGENHARHDDKVIYAAEEFDACARALASKYHTSRLRVGVSLLCKEQDCVATPDSVSIPSPSSMLENGSGKVPMPRSGSLPRSCSPPLPRSERKRLSQQTRPDAGAFSFVVDGADAQPRGDPAAVAALSTFLEAEGIADPMRSSENDEEAKTSEDAEPRFGQEQQGLFVQRDEMVWLARDLGYDISPTQATKLLDILDPKGHGRIAKDDLLTHFLPLLQEGERSTFSRKEYLGRRDSEHKPPRRPRPSSSPPATIPPPRPAGEPPLRPVGEPLPNTKRRIPFPLFEVGGGERLANTTTSNSNVSLALRARPAKFWVTRSVGGSDNRIDSLPPVGDMGCEEWGEHGGLDQDVQGSDHCREGGKRVRRRSNSDREINSISDRVAGLNTTDNTFKNDPEIKNGIQHAEWGHCGTINATGTSAKNSTSGENRTTHDGFCKNSNISNSTHCRGGESTFAEPWARRSMAPIQNERQGGAVMRHCSVTAAVAMPAPSSGGSTLVGKEVNEWTTADVLTWLRTLPRGLGAFAEADAFLGGRVDGKRLATLTLSDLKRKEFHHAKFRAKVPTALWVEIKQIQPSADVIAVPVSSRFSAGESIVDEAARTPLCTVTRFVGQGAFGEVYQVVWKGVGTDWGSTMAMKTVRLVDVSSDKRDEYRVLLVEEILTAVRVKPHPNVVNVRFAHIMEFCREDEEYFCFEDFVTGRNLGDIVAEGKGELYDGTTAEVQGRLLSYSIQLARGLGHIHRCGVLHQDIKSANVMVSQDGLMLITDFGFATVGHFGPPPLPTTTTPSTAESKPTAFHDETVNTTATQDVYKEDPARPVTSTEEEEGRGLVGVPSETYNNCQSHPRNNNKNSLADDARGPSGSTTTIAIPDAHDDARSSQDTDAGVVDGISKGKGITSDVTSTPACGAKQQDHRSGNSAKHSPRGQIRDTSNEGFRSQLLEGAKRAGGDRGFPNETEIGLDDEGKLMKAEEEDRDEGGRFPLTPPSRDCVLFGTLKGFTPRYQSPEICAIMNAKAKAASPALPPLIQSGRRSQDVASQSNSASKPPFTHRSDMWAAGVIILEMYAGGLGALRAGRGENAHTLLETLTKKSSRDCNKLQGVGNEDDRGKAASMPECGGTTGNTPGGAEAGKNTRKHDSGGSSRTRQEGDCFRVAMPGDVLELLQDIFRRDQRERPTSMQAVAARLSRTLRGMLEEGGAVVPCPTAAAPSPLSLCEETPPYVEVEENHGKVGRLHMWLGKALFLKGEDRRGQALQEYREGVRVLEQSKADRGSPSMALFRWYLGKALLEVGELNEALPHLTEAASINPDKAKYHYTLGLAKRMTGDEASARENLREAARLDEEDAEDRYQLRVQRNNSEQRRVGSKERDSVSEVKSHEEDVPQAALPSEDGLGQPETESTGKDSFANFKLPHFRRQALEATATSPTRIYGLQGLDEYRTGKSGGVDGFWAGGSGDSMDTVGGKHANWVGKPPEVRFFSIGDKICCGRYASTAAKPFEPMRCSSSRADNNVDGRRTYVIDGLLKVDQASVHLCDEAYTAAAVRRGAETETDDDATSRQAYNIVHIRFVPNNKDRSITSTRRVQTPTTTALSEQSHSPPAATNGMKQANGAVSVNYSSREAGGTFPSSEIAHDRPPRKGMVSTSSSSQSLQGSPFKLDVSFLSTLKAIARSAMVGFQRGLAGGIRDLTWTKGGITLVVDAVPRGCCTLRESLSGRLYQGTGIGRQEKKHGSEATGAAGVVERMLNLARQTAAAISRCHQKGVLLQDITPDDVLVTPRWEALLRPNYAHAREGCAWTTRSARETALREVQQQRQRSRRSSLGFDSESLTAPFSDTISPNYQVRLLLLFDCRPMAPVNLLETERRLSIVPTVVQSPEIAQIRRENQLLHRVSGKALRRSEPSLSSSPPASPSASHEPRLKPSPTSTPSPATTMRRSVCGSENTTFVSRSHAKIGFDEDRGPKVSERRERSRRIGDGLETNAGHAISESSRLSSPLRRKHSMSGVCGEDSSAPALVGDDDHGIPTVSPRTSDIWAWALIVLQMFSDEAWAPGSGQEGLTALESLLLRKRGVDTWTTDDVVCWLDDVGLWSEVTEREMRVFNIAGPQLLIPSCRRDIVEKLGLFIVDGELAQKLWENIAGGLQRWAVPPRLAQILRRCLADSPDDRYSTMKEVCELLRGVTADNDGANDDTFSTVLVTAGTRVNGGEDTAADSLRAGMILNDVGVCLHGKGLHEEAERHYKMALLAAEDNPEPHFNLGLLYAIPASVKFRKAQQAFETAVSLMGGGDPRRRVTVEHARAAERKSNYYQSQEVMQALSGKYINIASDDSQDCTSNAGGGGSKARSSSRPG